MPPLYSVFAPYGQLEYSSEPSDAEKIYDAARAGYIDPITGTPAVDMTEGTYHEAKLYARAMAIADAKATVRRSGNQQDPLKAVEALPHHEIELRLSPRPTDTIDERRAKVAVRRRRSRGNRYEALHEALYRILGDELVAIRPIAPHEATIWPDAPADGPGVFVRNEQPARVVRLLEPVTTLSAAADSYSEVHQDADTALMHTAGGQFTASGQTFTGNGRVLTGCRFYLQKSGSPTGTAVAKVYAHSGTFGTSGVPTGAALATSDALSVSSLTTSHVITRLAFSGANQITLADGTHYVLVIEYTAGTGGNIIQVGTDLTSPTHHGNYVWFASSAWHSTTSFATCFYVDTRTASTILYENWDTAQPAIQLVKGDVLAVQPENLGLAEKVTIESVAGSDTTRTFTAVFTKPHDTDASASTGPVPIWWSDLGHMFIVVTHEAAVDADLVAQVDEYLERVLKGGTTWSIVQPTTPGATTVGPFTLGVSPLGAVPIESLPIIALSPPVLGPCAPASGTTGGGSVVTLYGRRLADATDVKVDGASVAFTVVSDYEVTFTTVSHTAGAVSVEVTTPSGSTTEESAFTFVQASLSITSITPGTGPELTVGTIRGTGFYAITSVTIGGFDLALTIVDDNTMSGALDSMGFGPGAVTIDVATLAESTSVIFNFT